METTTCPAPKNKYPALFVILDNLLGLPDECSECPFAKPSAWRDPRISFPNPADLGEGEYDCSLLQEESVWGESPKCTKGQWAKRATQELVEAGIDPRQK